MELEWMAEEESEKKKRKKVGSLCCN